MNLLTDFRTTTLTLLIPLVLACFAVSPRVQAVVPAPDGAYPGFNTAEGGPSALAQAAPGVWNTALGQFTLNADNAGGIGNTAVGLNVLRFNTTGDFNSAVGVSAMINTTSANNNTAIGYQALKVNNGDSNTAVGLTRFPSTPRASRTRPLDRERLGTTQHPA